MTTTDTEPDLSLKSEDMGDLAQYGKDTSQFPPDKESEWTVPASKDGWTCAHNALRGEMDFLSKALTKLVEIPDGEVVDEWKIASIQAMWTHHSTHVQAHQNAEDTILTPALNERFTMPEKVMAGHADLDEMLEKVQKASEKYGNEKNTEACKAFLEEFKLYQKHMMEHLHGEEVWGLVLLRAYFSQADFKAVGQKMGKNSGPPGGFVYFMGGETKGDVFRQEFMPNHNMPGFLWYMVFSPALTEFENTFLRHAIALTETNQEPPPPVKSSYSCDIL